MKGRGLKIQEAVGSGGTQVRKVWQGSEGWRTWKFEGGLYKYSRELEEILKVGRGGSGSRHNVKGKVSQEPVWGEHKFSKGTNEVTNFSQQNHTNKKNSRQSWQSIWSVQVQEGGLVD